MDWIPVSEVPESKAFNKRASKWDGVVERLREQPGQIFVIASGLTATAAGDAVQALKKAEGIGAWSRSNDLPEGVEKTAVFARFNDPDQL